MIQTEVVSVDSEDKDAVERPRFLEGNRTPISKSKNGSRAKGNAQSGNRGLLVQPTLPSLFKKVEEKVISENLYSTCGNRLTATFRSLLELLIIFLMQKEMLQVKFSLILNSSSDEPVSVLW